MPRRCSAGATRLSSPRPMPWICRSGGGAPRLVRRCADHKDGARGRVRRREAGACADALVARLGGTARPALVHLRGRHQRGDVAERLGPRATIRAAHVVYDQVALPARRGLCRGAGARPLIVPLFSPRSADLFAEAAQPTGIPEEDRSSRSARRFGPRFRGVGRPLPGRREARTARRCGTPSRDGFSPSDDIGAVTRY
jgi:hypothetical protein